MTQPAGYSGKPLATKLGLAAGMRVAVLGAPEGFSDDLQATTDAALTPRLRKGIDMAVVFVTARRDLERRWPALTDACAPNGAVWVAWPKRASGKRTDMTEDVVREVVLPTGWVDTKVCAVDATWSGLKCVLRRSLRG